MAIGLGLFLAISIGHACFCVWIVNVSHGLGINWRGMDRAVLIGLAGLALGTLFWEWRLATTPVAAWSWAALAYAWFCVFLSCAILPLSTLMRVFRRRPVLARSIAHREIDFAAELGAKALIGPGRHNWCLKLPRPEAFRVQFEEYDVFLKHLPEVFEGFSVVHLTDFHFAPCFDRRFFEEVVARVALWDADLIAFTGDLVDNDEAIRWIEPVFAPLGDRPAKLAILGNHDVHHHPALIARELERAGFQMIDGGWTTIDRQGERIAFGGTSAPWGPTLDWNARPEAASSVVLSHSPDLFTRSARAGIDLTLSGHNHGGQVRLPIIGPILMPSSRGRYYDLDFFRKGDSLLYVGRGLGGKHPLRYGCPPEVTRLVLRRANRTASTTPSLKANSRKMEVNS